jgi:alpha-N-acetylglucosaminidase
MLVLDLWGDRSPAWKTRRAFYGKPWIWNVLYNFGGKVSVNGDLPRIAANLDTAITSPERGRLEGLGMTMEGLGTNPIVPDFVLSQIWRGTVPDVTAWTRDWVARRYGHLDHSAWRSWELLLTSAFRSAAQNGNFLAERPQFYVKGRAYRSEPIPPYDGQILAKALDSLLAAAPRLSSRDAYRYDVVNLTRQVLDQLGLPLVNDVEAAYDRKDRKALLAAEGQVEALLTDLDRLVGTRPEFLLGRWLADAKRWGKTDSERRLYEWNARNLITLWGTKCTEGENDDLNLYAYKEWQGMFSRYFLPRWKDFFGRLNQSLDSGTTFNREPFARSSCDWEQRWSRGTDTHRTVPEGDPVAVARELVRKWRP